MLMWKSIVDHGERECIRTDDYCLELEADHMLDMMVIEALCTHCRSVLSYNLPLHVKGTLSVIAMARLHIFGYIFS